MRSILGEMGRTLVAYSGGVDSAYLLYEANHVLGDRAVGVIGKSPSLPAAELDGALALAANRGIPVRVVETREMERAAYQANGPDRCYHCKAELFERLGAIAADEGWDSVAYGALVDDLGDVRPGMAAAERYRIRAPLIEAGLGKLDVRILARQAALPVWDKPQSACLASRVPHGSEVTPEKLERIERGEGWLRATLGLRVVRLRYDGVKARIEVLPSEVARISAPAVRSTIYLELNKLGFGQIEIDPNGYRRADPTPLDDPEVLADAEAR